MSPTITDAQLEHVFASPRRDPYGAGRLLRELVMADALHAYDRLERYLSDAFLATPVGPEAAQEILSFFAPTYTGGEGKGWNPLEKRHALHDERWIKRALELRHDRRIRVGRPQPAQQVRAR